MKALVPESSLQAAHDAAAKVNAMLVASGQLRLSQLQKCEQWRSHVTKSNNDFYVDEFDINDAPMSARNLLTKSSFQEEISKMSGASVSTRGRFMSEDEKNEPNRNPLDRPLYLHIQSVNEQDVKVAVGRITHIILEHRHMKPSSNSNNSQRQRRNRANQGNGDTPVVPVIAPEPVTVSAPPPLDVSATIANQYQLIPTSAVMPLGKTVCRERVFMPSTFGMSTAALKARLEGPDGENLRYILQETGVTVTIQGQGSGALDPMSGTEFTEPMHFFIQHPDQNRFQQAKNLVANLAHTIMTEVQQEISQMAANQLNFPPPFTQQNITIGLLHPSQATVTLPPNVTHLSQQHLHGHVTVDENGIQLMQMAPETQQVLLAQQLHAAVITTNHLMSYSMAPPAVSFAQLSSATLPVSAATPQLLQLPMGAQVFAGGPQVLASLAQGHTQVISSLAPVVGGPHSSVPPINMPSLLYTVAAAPSSHHSRCHQLQNLSEPPPLAPSSLPLQQTQQVVALVSLPTYSAASTASYVTTAAPSVVLRSTHHDPTASLSPPDLYFRHPLALAQPSLLEHMAPPPTAAISTYATPSVYAQHLAGSAAAVQPTYVAAAEIATAAEQAYAVTQVTYPAPVPAQPAYAVASQAANLDHPQVSYAYAYAQPTLPVQEVAPTELTATPIQTYAAVEQVHPPISESAPFTGPSLCLRNPYIHAATAASAAASFVVASSTYESPAVASSQHWSHYATVSASDSVAYRNSLAAETSLAVRDAVATRHQLEAESAPLQPGLVREVGASLFLPPPPPPPPRSSAAESNLYKRARTDCGQGESEMFRREFHGAATQLGLSEQFDHYGRHRGPSFQEHRPPSSLGDFFRCPRPNFRPRFPMQRFGPNQRGRSRPLGMGRFQSHRLH